MTKIDSISSSNPHLIRLAQQELLLELTKGEQETDEEQLTSISREQLEQMTMVELRHQCKRYQIGSSHANKTTLIQRIKQVESQLQNSSNSFDRLFSG